ncbi:TSUP family transporter [Duganella sp. FT135W]|uniref:Probable membrane transporter protein n=1 Tax=Duganella flavida TaxID=2692175 RepID=A0A6L8KK78_9BURK|nr:sulfite exporter TauE/SafE family protein [Duganella flavida]MYM24951.1 TSUP family transporter [Duganella flavida]
MDILLYLGLGAFAGILAGLLGVGGGTVIVPVLTLVYAAHGFPPQYTLHLALGTSMASILFTSVASLRSHHRRGAVDWVVVRQLTPGIVLGTLAGVWLTAHMSSNLLKAIFVAFAYFVAVQMLMNIKPAPSRQLPESGGMLASGGAIGVVSSFVGIGGGTLSVPFMTWCNVPLHTVIGTSAALGFPIALAGATGYVLNGWRVAGLPEHSLGFVYLPALIAVAGVSVLTAPLGARLAHALPVAKLKKLFALLLLAVGTRMLFSL